MVFHLGSPSFRFIKVSENKNQDVDLISQTISLNREISRISSYRYVLTFLPSLSQTNSIFPPSFPWFKTSSNLIQKITKAKGLLGKTAIQICKNLMICDKSCTTYKDIRNIKTFHKVILTQIFHFLSIFLTCTKPIMSF